MDGSVFEPAGTRLLDAFRRDVLHGAPLPCTAIAAADPMLRYFLGQRQGHREAALVDYLATGLSAAQAVDAVLRWRFGARHDEVLLLDFASGYGRVARFLAQRLSPRRLWVSDLLPGAVDFQKSHFGVHGFLSAADPGRLACAQTFDAITVASLFSHLPPAQFVPWLRRLWSLLRPGGVLMFSVHDVALRAAGGGTGTPRFEAASEIPEHAAEQYGTSWVDESFVATAVREATGASCLRVPRGLWVYQDVYLVCRGEAPAAPPRWSQARGYVERAERTYEGDVLMLDGWFHDPLQDERNPSRIRVQLDGERIAELPVDRPRGDVAGFVGKERAIAGWGADLRRREGFAGEAVLSVVGVGASGETLLHLGSVEGGEMALRLGYQLSLLRAEVDEMRQSRFWKLRDAWWELRRRLPRWRARRLARSHDLRATDNPASGAVPVRATLALLLLVWSAIAFGRESWSACDDWRHRFERPIASPWMWRLGTPALERLARCMQRAASVAPADSMVAFGDRDADFLRWRWAAYELPQNDVLMEHDPSATTASVLVTVGGPPAGTGVRSEARRACTIQRLR